MVGLPVKYCDAITPVTFQNEIEHAKAFYNQQYAPGTIRAYKSDWQIFVTWCRSRGFKPLPAGPESLAIFLSCQAYAGLKATTLARRLAAIRHFHALAGVSDSPTNSELVRAAMRGIRRSIGAAKDQKAPATADKILIMIDHIRNGIRGIRDRAILLFGFAGAFRRSELSALLVEDLEAVPDGLRVHIRKSKTDQEGEGQVVPIIKGDRACPVIAVQTWLEAANIENGPVFRRLGKGGRIFENALTPYSISQIVKTHAGRAGFDSTLYSGHSLRSGFLTSAALNGASISKMMDVSRHKSVDILLSYVRQAEEFKDHAGHGLL